MFKYLRQRLIWSHILPILIALPLMGIWLVYILEGQFLIPNLARNLVSNGRLLAEITSAEYELWGDPLLFENLISRVQLDPSIQVMFLDGEGTLLFSSDPGDQNLRGRTIQLPGISSVISGKETSLTNYSLFNMGSILVDTYEPVFNTDHQVIGIVRLTYQVSSIYEIFDRLRWQILLAVLLGLLPSSILGMWLAISISRPVDEVTSAIYDLATGKRMELVQEKGPEEIRSQARAVNFLVEQMRELETSRRQLLANLVHELGRPLGALRSAIHALSKGANQDPKLLMDLTHGMDEELYRLQFLLDELANLYDKTRGSLELNLEKIDTNQWLQDILAPWRAAAEEKRIEWLEEVPPSLPSITIDPQRMAQVLGNLLSNAVKFTSKGGLIKFSTKFENGNILFIVKDNGAGISEEDSEKIFLPFYQGNTGKRIKQGMGIGLTIAKEIVTAHGGQISAVSLTGEGSEFTVLLPGKIIP